MTTSEIIQAEELGRWIDGDRDTLPNAECAVAVWVLRPDLVPNPRVTLDDVLSRVTSGPFFEREVGEDGVSEDDFVEALFTQVRNSSQTKVSLDDILTRVESGPFAKLEGDIEIDSVNQTAVEATSPSANNNRWWSSPAFSGGLAAALVLFILIPTQFKSTVSEDSMFATSFEVEDPLPAEEMAAKKEPKQKGGFGKSATLNVQRPPTRKEAEDTQLDSDEAPSLRVIESENSKPLKKSIARGVVSETESPPQIEIIQPQKRTLESDTMNSLDIESASQSIDTNDFNGSKNSIITNLFDGQYDSYGSDNIAGHAAEGGAVATDAREGVEAESIEMSVDSTVGAIDRVPIESVAKSSGRQSKRQQKSKGFLFKRMESASAEDVAEETVSMEKSEEAASVGQLPSVLTEEQRRLLNQATNAPAVFALCDNRQPTQALEILWTASGILPTSDAITVLKQSSGYDHGDVRYLKRNWLLLSSLLYQIGQSEEAKQYQLLAFSLP